MENWGYSRASTVLAARQLGQEASNHVPLLVHEVTGMTRSGVGHPDRMALSLSSLPKLALPRVQKHYVTEDRSAPHTAALV